MSHKEKAELLRETIRFLYEKEGRNFSYIGRLLEIPREIISAQIKEWGFVKANVRHAKPSTRKALNKNKKKIISMLNKDIDASKIEEELGLTKYTIIQTYRALDKDIDSALNAKNERMHNAAKQRVSNKKKDSFHEYGVIDIHGELWKEILGYPSYYVSNMGRFKRYIKTYNDFYLLKTQQNSKSKRLYVSVVNAEGKRRNLLVSRVVAATFCDGKSDKNNTVNHKDGDFLNNRAENLEWISQSENNKHSYTVLNRKKNISKAIPYTIVYKDKYTFKTITAFAKFLNKSWTQTGRYLKEPEKHEIKLIKKCNCND